MLDCSKPVVSSQERRHKQNKFVCMNTENNLRSNNHKSRHGTYVPQKLEVLIKPKMSLLDLNAHNASDSTTAYSHQMSEENETAILSVLKEILQELRELNGSAARFDEFVLELSPSEATEEIKDLKQ